MTGNVIVSWYAADAGGKCLLYRSHLNSSRHEKYMQHFMNRGPADIHSVNPLVLSETALPTDVRWHFPSCLLCNTQSIWIAPPPLKVCPNIYVAPCMYLHKVRDHYNFSNTTLYFNNSLSAKLATLTLLMYKIQRDIYFRDFGYMAALINQKTLNFLNLAGQCTLTGTWEHCPSENQAKETHFVFVL